MNLLNDLRANPNLGIELGHHLRKVRMSIASKGKGKSGGARVITYTLILAETDTIPFTVTQKALAIFTLTLFHLF